MNRLIYLVPLLGLFFACNTLKTDSSIDNSSLFKEIGGYLLVEAEEYHRQSLDTTRKWYRIDRDYQDGTLSDPDVNHFIGAGSGAYLEILPDTRTNHDEKLIHKVNFSNEPGQLGILEYDVMIQNPGRYYVWVRTFFTGTEDNGIHVGLDGKWVESGQRMQWCDNRGEWTWDSKQRTEQVHCGVEKQIFLDIDTAGKHTVSFSMREDGFEFDQWVISKKYERPY